MWPLAAIAQQRMDAAGGALLPAPTIPMRLFSAQLLKSAPWSPLAFGWMNSFAPGEHFYKLANSLVPRF
jgi:hypothetical protein